MAIERPVTAPRTLTAARSVTAARTLSGARVVNIEAQRFTPLAIWRNTGTTGPVGSTTMTFVTGLYVTGLPTTTEYYWTIGQANSQGGFGVRCIQSAGGGGSTAIDGFVVDGAFNPATFPSAVVQASGQGKLIVLHHTFVGGIGSTYRNGAGVGTPTVITGYTVRNPASAVGKCTMGALNATANPCVVAGGLVFVQVYESTALSAGQVATHSDAIIAALQRGSRAPASAAGTLSYSWDSRDATSVSWPAEPASGVFDFSLVNAGYVPGKLSFPPRT